MNKKISSILSFAVVVAAISFISSCKPKTEAPIISLSKGSTGNAAIYSNLTFDILMNSDANAELKSLTITKKIAGIDDVTVKTLSGVSYTFPYIDTIKPGATLIEYTFMVTDNQNMTATTTFTLTVTTPSTWGVIDERDGAPIDNQWTSGGRQFWCFTNPAATFTNNMNIDEAKQNYAIVDFCYGSRGVSNGANFIGAPNSTAAAAIYDNSGIYKLSLWTKLNATQFKLTTLTGADWAGITNDSTVLANTASGMSNQVMNLTKAGGQIISFVLVNGKKGLIKTTTANGAHEPPPNGTPGNLTWKFKIQQ